MRSSEKRFSVKFEIVRGNPKSETHVSIKFGSRTLLRPVLMYGTVRHGVQYGWVRSVRLAVRVVSASTEDRYGFSCLDS